MALPEERKFATFRRGKVRDDIILAHFRNSLRTKINPDTGQFFTEDEIAIITQEDSRFFTEADAIDLYGQAVQARALWFADQVRPERAASGWLFNVHGALWAPDGLLPATGGSGLVRARGSAGTVYVGSSVLGDPGAAVARDPSGKRYQVMVTKVAGSSGIADLNMQAVDPGDSTNLAAGTLLTWSLNVPIGTNPQAEVLADFSGGFDLETEYEYAQRINRRIGSKPGSGNAAHFRDWANASSNAIQDSFVYSTALHAGSTIVAILQKRGNTVGPLARIPNFATLAAATAYLTPPSSPVVPDNVHVLVVPPQSQTCNVVMSIGMRRNSVSGWSDPTPWPRFTPAYPQGVIIVNTGMSGTDQWIEVDTDDHLDNATAPNVPSLMVWERTTSKFIPLDVKSIVRTGDTHRITLNTPLDNVYVGTHRVSPDTELRDSIASAFESYFDSLGPGELVAPDDVRFVRAKRYPSIDDEYPIRAGQNIITSVSEHLGGAMSEGEVSYLSVNTPQLPFDGAIVDGPYLLTLNEVGIYPL